MSGVMSPMSRVSAGRETLQKLEQAVNAGHSTVCTLYGSHLELRRSSFFLLSVQLACVLKLTIAAVLDPKYNEHSRNITKIINALVIRTRGSGCATACRIPAATTLSGTRLVRGSSLERPEEGGGHVCSGLLATASKQL